MPGGKVNVGVLDLHKVPQHVRIEWAVAGTTAFCPIYIHNRNLSIVQRRVAMETAQASAFSSGANMNPYVTDHDLVLVGKHPDLALKGVSFCSLPCYNTHPLQYGVLNGLGSQSLYWVEFVRLPSSKPVQ